MSSLSRITIARRARQRLTEQEEAAAGFSLPMLRSLIDDALYRLADEVSRSSEWREFFKEVTLTAVAGVAPFTDATLLLDSLPRVGFVEVSSVLARWKPTYQALKATQDLSVPHYAFRGPKLAFKAITTGSLTSVAGAVVTAGLCYVQTLAELGPRWETPLIDKVVLVAIEKAQAGPPAAATAREDKVVTPKVRIEGS